MSGNTVNLNFFLAKNGVSWENIGITKPNTECIAGQASTPASRRPSSHVSKQDNTSPTSGARQKAARSPIRKWSRDHHGVFERRKYPKAPKSPFASTFHIGNSPTMSEKERRQRTTDITRFRGYIKQRTYNIAEDAAETARDAADKAWSAFMEAEKAAKAAEEVARKAEEALEKLQEVDEAPHVDQQDKASDLGDGSQTPRWTETEDGGVDYLGANPGAGDDQAPFKTISMDQFPEHKTMLDCGANQIAAGFADLVHREFEGRSEAEREVSLQEAEDELKKRKKLLPPLQRKDRATERAISHARSLQARGKTADVSFLQAEARRAAREVRRGSMNVQAAIRKVRADRWSLQKSGELEREKSRLSKYFA